MRRFVLAAALAAALVLGGLASGAARKPLVVNVNHVRAYLDMSGPGKGELLIRVFSDYGRHNVKGKWWGVTEASVRGPGGLISIADIRRLHHPERGERVDHRMLLRPAATRHLLGRAGAHAKLKILAGAYLIPIRAPGSAARASCCAIALGVNITRVQEFPGPQRTFGNGALTVDWTETAPFLPFASKFFESRTGDEIDGARAIIQPDGSFSATGTDTCGDPATYSGSVTPPDTNDEFPANATASVSWKIPYNDLGACGSSGSSQYPIDP